MLKETYPYPGRRQNLIKFRNSKVAEEGEKYASI